MGSTFPRVKIWSSGEDVTHTDLNAEFQNVLDNLTPSGADDHSTNATQMRIQTDPGSVGSESLATSTAGEVERLRYAISRVIGGTYWYSTPPQSLTQLNALISVGVPQNRIVSGRTRSATDGFPVFLVPDGTAQTVTLKGASTNFNVFINAASYTGTTDVTRTGLALAPAANNTCLVNDSAFVSQVATKYAGSTDALYPTITIDTVGSEISALVGKYAAFKKGAEYFVAYVNSATQLTNALRGAFFDSADSPIVRVTLADNDTITLCKLHWIYYKTDGTLTNSTTNPTFSSDSPGSPSSGDYWYDLTNQQWKSYDGASWAAANAHLIGWAICDTSGCKAARSFDFYVASSALNTVTVTKVDNATVRVYDYAAKLSVNGTTFSWDKSRPFWGMAAGIGGSSDIESGFAEASSTDYWFYVTERGDLQISPERPYDRRTDLLGFYHPYHLWRAVGYATNDGSSNLLDPIAYRGTNILSVNITTTSNWTVPPNCFEVLAYIGAGGGGGGGANESAGIGCGGGGGSGGCVTIRRIRVTPGQSLPMVIGAGGGGGAIIGGHGALGGTTIFANAVTGQEAYAYGGSGGSGSPNTAVIASGGAASPGGGGGGDGGENTLNTAARSGASAWIYNGGSGSTTKGGGGGAGLGGPGGTGGTTGAGSAAGANTCGGGGGGGYNPGIGHGGGGAGGSGLIILYYAEHWL